jgi:chemotaxis response regulator CheB
MKPDTRPLVVWVDDHALAVFPGLDADLAGQQAMVMRSFQRVPLPGTVAQFDSYRQVAVVGGVSFESLVSRVERTASGTRLPVVAVMPRDAPPTGTPSFGPGVVDVLRPGAADVARRIVTMSTVPVVSIGRGPAAGSFQLLPAERKEPVIAIASSTGGTFVLSELLRRIPVGSATVLVAQHIDADFAGFFASWLSDTSRWPVDVVTSPQPCASGRLYVGTGGMNLQVGSGPIVSCVVPKGRFVPSGDVLLSGVAAVFGAAAVGVVLSGMGDDGAVGLSAIAAAGGRAFVQAPESALIASMPQAALTRTPRAVPIDPRDLVAALAGG